MLKVMEVKQTKRRNAQKDGIKIVEIKEVTKVKENCKKLLTKRGVSGRIIKLSRERRRKKYVAVKKLLKNF